MALDKKVNVRMLIGWKIQVSDFPVFEIKAFFTTAVPQRLNEKGHYLLITNVSSNVLREIVTA